jgi:hypothetical protein
MKPAVEAAIADIRAGFPDHEVRVKPDSDGGAYVIIDSLEIGDSFTPHMSWLGFQITWTCPESDTYPHFIDLGVRYVGQGETPNQYPEGNLPTSMTRNATMPGFELAAIQVSRRSNHRNAATDSPFQKLLRIIEFLASR